ncbi:AzlD family protein [uncultured Agrobacterium sp.]|uniref:AzlD family protein n=1 Tax=uncultured Agrobacterium sp. TaxID=157277 RepID=UPI0025F80187|nr:AzlD family protein [uncultured Agrobacterium sp.]
MSLDPNTLLTILAMAFATVLTRFGGLVLIRHVHMTDRATRALNAVPPAVLMAVVTPTAFTNGLAESIGCAVTALAATRFSLLPAAGTGVVTVALLRALGL